MGVIDEVEEIVFTGAVKEHELEVLGANAFVGGNLMSGFTVVAVVELVAPVVGRLTRFFEHRHQRFSLEVEGDLSSCEVEKGGGVVNILNEGFGGGAGLDDAGPANDEGHFKGLFEHPALVIPAVFAEVESLVGGVDDDGVFGEATGFEFVEDDADAFIHGANGAQVVFNVALIFPLRDLFVAEFGLLSFWRGRLGF